MGTLSNHGKIEASSNRWLGGSTPFRYPGGKGFIADTLQQKIEAWIGSGAQYAEPFAGGAGAAIRLLARNTVQRVRINDADVRIFSAWEAILRENERFLDTLAECETSISAWHKHAELVKEPKKAKSRFELGFATFFLNRTNRSGIVLGAGPIGGYEQRGEWKLDARFNKHALAERVRWLGQRADQIVLTQKDGITFLRDASRRKYARETFFFVDPPYVSAGSRLYLNAMNERKHQRLASLLQSGTIQHWLVTYDKCPLIDEAYRHADLSLLEVPYSLQARRKEGERMVVPAWKSKAL
ncbi:DNA adenine methylase [Citromicrobium bathyomarinum]|uniref:DNA adenine methylase n=1 Tax=Citromicrobium bathyomarinum TaxID=72174 RepID=UPI00315A95F7